MRVIMSERIGAATFKRDDADHFVFVNERHGHFRMVRTFLPTFTDMIIRIVRNIAHDHRMTILHGAPDNALRDVCARGL